MIDAREITKADVLALLAGRIRAAYGGRLAGLYAIKDDPHEPTGDPAAIFLVAVLHEPFSFFDETETTSTLADQINREMEGAFVATVYPVSAADFDEGDGGPARVAAREGVRL